VGGDWVVCVTRTRHGSRQARPSLAQVSDAHEVTLRRTAAASAVATRALSRDVPSVLALLGTGPQACASRVHRVCCASHVHVHRMRMCMCIACTSHVHVHGPCSICSAPDRRPSRTSRPSVRCVASRACTCGAVSPRARPRWLRRWPRRLAYRCGCVSLRRRRWPKQTSCVLSQVRRRPCSRVRGSSRARTCAPHCSKAGRLGGIGGALGLGMVQGGLGWSWEVVLVLLLRQLSALSRVGRAGERRGCVHACAPRARHCGVCLPCNSCVLHALPFT